MVHRDQLLLKTPASWHRDLWREALPMGNGILGGLVFGGIAQETILINHARLWHRGVRQPLPDISDSLEKARRLMDEGNYWDANRISADALKQAGYAGRLATPLPLCALRIDMGERAPFSHYRRTLDMDTAQVRVSWQEGERSFLRESFISREGDYLALRIRGQGGLDGCKFSLAIYDTGEDDTRRVLEEIGGSLSVESDGCYQSFALTHEDGSDYGAVMRIDPCGGKVLQEGQALMLTGTDTCCVWVRFFVGGQKQTDWIVLRRELAQMDADYERALERHAALHRPLYHSADLRIASDGLDTANENLLLDAYEDTASNALLEKLWRFGRYLMVCATRPDGLPFPLYGLWHGRYSMAWPHNMANENLQMIYWHTQAGGLISLTRAVIDYYVDMLDDFRENARKLFGLPGIYVPAGTTPGIGLPNQIVPVIMNWIGAAGWLCRHFYDYYRWTGDEELFAAKIFPFIMETAQFYSAYLTEEDGICKIYPSVSPENTPKSLMPSEEWEHMAHPCPSAVNATMDIAIIKEVFGTVIEQGARMGVDEETIEQISRQRSRLPAYETTSEGNIREWNYPGLTERYTHRHLSHLYPIFPGVEFMASRDPEQMKAFALAADKRVLGSQSGWSLAHMACIYARLGRGEQALSCLDNLTKSCLTNSFFTLHNDWRSMGLTLGRDSFAPVQLDACMGIVNALQEMLFFWGDGRLHILPACPERLARASAENLHFPGGTASFSWDLSKGALSLDIRATRDVSLTLCLPAALAHCRIVTAHGEPATGTQCKLSLRVGEHAHIRS